ncbi:hypothetical protein lerEdw1_005576 [Lerista edwardsae]|nr:hypothetical protein lerEdw1_005576 [Lerista edwardsae]
MTEITAEGPVSTTTVIDNKNGTVPIPHMRMSKRSVSEDFVTTFSSPAAWLLVVALIVTWSAVAIVMFDLVDYKNLAGQSVNKLTTSPFRIIHSAVEETTDWVYGFLSLLSDLMFEDEEESERGEVEPSLKIKEEIQPPVKKKELNDVLPLEIQIDKSEEHKKVEKKPAPKEVQVEKVEKKLPTKEIHEEKPKKPDKPRKPEKPEKVEKPEKRELPKAVHKEKPERHEKLEKREKLEKKEKPEKRGKLEHPAKQEKKEKAIVSPKEKPAKPEKPKKKVLPSKVTDKIKPEQQEKIEKKLPPKEKETIKVEEKAKKDMKEPKLESKAPERKKHKEVKAEEVAPTKAKAKMKEETALAVREKSEMKDQYAFCRYMIDIFAHGDLYTGSFNSANINPNNNNNNNNNNNVCGSQNSFSSIKFLISHKQSIFYLNKT